MSEVPQSSKSGPKVFLTKIIGGKVFSTVLDKGAGEAFLSENGYSLIADGEDLGRVRPRITMRCPACGCSREAFEKTGRFGCPECYRAFGPFLSPLLKRMHKGPRHLGKVPSSRLTPEVADDRIKDLEAALHSAVQAEEYEEAARLRDEMRVLADRREVLR